MQTAQVKSQIFPQNISRISLQSLTLALAHTPSAIFIALVVVCTARLYWCEYVCLCVCVCVFSCICSNGYPKANAYRELHFSSTHDCRVRWQHVYRYSFAYLLDTRLQRRTRRCGSLAMSALISRFEIRVLLSWWRRVVSAAE